MMPTPDPDSGAATAAAFRAGARATRLACACLFVAMLNLTLVVAGLKELVVDELGGSVTDAALFFTVEMVAYLLFAPLWGALSDRFGRRQPFIVGSFAASGLLYFAYLRIDSIPLLLALRLLQGGAAIAGWSTTLALLFDRADALSAAPAPRRFRRRLADPRRRTRRAARRSGHAVLGRAGTARPGRSPLPPARAAVALALRRGPRSAHPAPPGGDRPRARLAAAPAPPLGLYAMERFTVGLFVIVFPLWLLEQHGADPAARGRALAAFLLPFAFLQLGTYRLARRFGPFVLLGARLFSATPSPSLPSAASAPAPTTRSSSPWAPSRR